MTGPLTRPPALRRGDRVAVVATSGVVDRARLERGTAWLGGLGLDVVIGDHVLSPPAELPFLAASDADRARDLERAWCDPTVRAVLAARGGTGSSRVVDRLDWSAMAAAGPKLLVGCSDVTALVLALAARLGLGALFGPVAAGELLGGPDGPEPRSAAHLAQALLHPEQAVVLETAEPAAALGPAAVVEGRLAGGTLSLLSTTTGTPDALDARGAVVVLEDVGEAPYRLHRLLTHLRRSGGLDGAVGVACGDWTGCGDPAAVRAVLVDTLADLGVPVLTGLPFGHGPVQLSLPLGATAVLDPVAGRLTVPSRAAGPP